MFLLKPRFGLISFFSQSSKEKKRPYPNMCDCFWLTDKLRVLVLAYRAIPYALSFHNPPPCLPGQCLCTSGSFVEVPIASLFQNATSFCFILMTPGYPLRPPQMSLLVWSLLWFYPGELLLLSPYPVAVPLFCFYTFPSGDFERPSRERRDCLT